MGIQGILAKFIGLGKDNSKWYSLLPQLTDEAEVCILEVMPETATLKVGSDATMGIFYEGKPLANAKCIIFNRGWQDLLMTKSGADGKVTFKVDQPGDYIVIAKYTDTTKAVSEEFDETSFTTALTIGAE